MLRGTYVTLIALLTTASQAQLFTQVWTHTTVLPSVATGSGIDDSAVLPNGQFVGVGWTYRNGEKQGLVVRYSRAGTLIRTDVCGVPDTYYDKVRVDADGNFYAIGEDEAHSQPIISRYSMTGGAMWDFPLSLGADKGYIRDALVMPDRNLLITGERYFGVDADPYVARILTTGTLSGKAGTPYDMGNDERPTAMTYDPATGAIYIVGVAGNKSFIWALDDPATTNYYLSYQTSTTMQTSFACVGIDGPNLIIGGQDQTNASPFISSPMIYVVNIGVATVVTHKTLDSYAGRISSIFKDPAGNFMASGYAYSGDILSTFAAKFNPDTNDFMWSKIVNDPNLAELSPIASVADAFGELYVLVNESNFGQPQKGRLIKISGAGGVRFQAPMVVTPTTHTSQPFCTLALHPASGDVYCAGGFFDAGTEKTRGYIFRQAPTTIADGYVLKKNTTYTSPRTLTANDRQWQGATCTLRAGVLHGTLSLKSNATFTYKPTTGFTGVDSFEYTLSKPGVSPSSAKVTLQVTN